MADDGQAAAGGMEQNGQNGQNGQIDQGGQQPAAGTGDQAPAWKALGIPAHMMKDSAEDTLGEVFKAFDGFQKKASAQGPVGKTPDDYKFEFADDLKPWFGNADDPALAAFRAVAHEEGMPVKTANAVLNKVFGKLAKDGKLPPPFNPKAEMDAIAQQLGKAGPEAAAAYEQATVEMQGWAQNMGQKLKLSDGEQVELESLMLTANGFGVMRKLMAAGEGDAFRMGGQGADLPLSREELDRMSGDERLNPFSPKYDAAFREKYDKGWANRRK